jgi:hypothetical protein
MNKSQFPYPEEWRQIIDGQPPSGLTVAAYCRHRGIKDSAFYAWKRRLRSPVKPNRLPQPAFVEAKPSIRCESPMPTTRQTAATPAMIQFLLISKIPTTGRQFGQMHFARVEWRYSENA